MQLINYAAWIPEEQAGLEVGTAAFPSRLSGDEIVIKNHPVAVNPVDWKIQSSGGLRAPVPVHPGRRRGGGGGRGRFRRESGGQAESQGIV